MSCVVRFVMVTDFMSAVSWHLPTNIFSIARALKEMKNVFAWR